MHGPRSPECWASLIGCTLSKASHSMVQSQVISWLTKQGKHYVFISSQLTLSYPRNVFYFHSPGVIATVCLESKGRLNGAETKRGLTGVEKGQRLNNNLETKC